MYSYADRAFCSGKIYFISQCSNICFLIYSMRCSCLTCRKKFFENVFHTEVLSLCILPLCCVKCICPDVLVVAHAGDVLAQSRSLAVSNTVAMLD